MSTNTTGRGRACPCPHVHPNIPYWHAHALYLQSRRNLDRPVSKLTAFSLLLLILSACGPSPTPVLIPAGPTPIITPGTNPSPLATSRYAATPLSLFTSMPSPINIPMSVPSDPPTATQLPPPATSTSPPTPTPAAQIPLSLIITPRVTQRLGDAITLTWQAGGGQAALCPVLGPGPVASQCVDVPLSGSRTITVDESMLPYLGYALRVTSGSTVSWAIAGVVFGCQGLRDWFFSPPPERCPAASVQTSEAAAQPFEHGLKFWTKTTDTFYAFFDGDGSQPQFFEFASHVHLKPGASPDHRVGGEPPGRIDPVSGFGMLWRGEFEEFSNVRARLGWGLLPEFPYTSSYQCETASGPQLWTCYLAVPGNKVLQLRPDSTAQVHFLWRAWP